MKHFVRAHVGLFLIGIAIVAVLILCAWMFGWGGGSIDLIEYSADEIEYIELFSTDVNFGLHMSVLTEKGEIQALIDSINSFRHTGNSLKHIFKDGLFLGRSVLYGTRICLAGGTKISINFATNYSDQPRSDMEVSYWIHQPGCNTLFPNECRGSMELYFELYDKYKPIG